MVWTPGGLRNLTAKANKGFENREQANKADRIQKKVSMSLAAFEEMALGATKEGLSEAVGGEFVLGVNDLLTDEDREILHTLTAAYQHRGFTTRMHGPYTDGGPTHVYHGLDLIVSWAQP